MRRRKCLLALLWLVYIAAISVLAYSRRGAMATVFDFEYAFGDIVRSLYENNRYASFDGFLTAHRMPFIPYFLLTLTLLNPNALFVYIAKNILMFSLSGVAFYWIAQHLRQEVRIWFWLLMILVFFSPPIIQYGTMPDVEEGYLIHLVAFIFACLCFYDDFKLSGNKGMLLLLAFANAIIFLTKSSMMISSCLLAGAFFLRSHKDTKVLGFFVGALVIAAMLWGGMNLSHSGRFSLSSSLNGWNFYKGNNKYTATLYPPYNLDLLDQKNGLLIEGIDEVVHSEWDLNQYGLDNGINFIITSPQEAAQLFVQKFYVFFVEIRRTPIWEGEQQLGSLIDWISVPFMLVFRLLFAGLVIRILRYVFLERDRISSENDAATLIGVIFVAFVGIYAVPYLIGFAYERHVSVLIMPTVIVCIYWLNQCPLTPTCSRLLRFAQRRTGV